MTVPSDVMAAMSSGPVEAVDLTAPLSAQTPILTLPEPLGTYGARRACQPGSGDRPP